MFIADPSGVEKNVVAQVTDTVDDLTRVINRAVIGTELDQRQTERTLRFSFFRIDFGDFRAQIVFFKAMFIHAADKTERVSSGFQINRFRADLYQRAVVHGFVVVAVEQYDVARV